jgi:RNA polymerase sigma-70 factor (ECF subfamily)
MGGERMVTIICAVTEDPSDKDYMLWLYQEFSRLMFFTAGQYIADPMDREDVVQDALVRLIKKIPDLRKLKRNLLAAYIVATVRNTSIDHLRRQGVWQEHCVPLDEESEPEEFSLDEITQLVYVKDGLSKIWGQLLEEERALLGGKYIAGYSDVELAELLACKPSSIRMKLTRSRRHALALLTQYEGEVLG